MADEKTFEEVLDPGSVIVSVLEFKGQLLVATSRNIFRIENGNLVPLRFVVLEERNG